jgi:hypothetical protein
MSHPAIAGLWTQPYRAMARALYPDDDNTGEPVLLDWYRSPERGWFADHTESLNNESGLAMHVFPRHRRPTRYPGQASQDKPWKLPSPHLDHASKGHGFRSCCLPMRMSSMVYLTDSTDPAHGGSTVVWSGSHHKVAALAASDPERFEMLHVLSNSLGEAGVLDLEPVELKVQAGDVLFHDMFLAHYGSENHAPGKPRMAFNMKWGRQ